MEGIKLGLLAVLIAIALAGCGNGTLDWDNARISGGKVYAGKANEPFSGHVVNAPQQLFISRPEADLLGLHFRNVEPANRQEAMYTPPLICDLDTKDGQRDGKVECRTNSGQVRLKGEFDSGEATGEWIIYDTKGGVSLSARLNNRKLDGRLEIYNPNGQGKLLSQGYKNGVPDGSDERWLGNGTQVLSTSWSNGKQNGLHREWWDYGKLKMQMTYKDGQQEGLITFYNDDGSISSTTGPFQGEYARVTRYGQNGEVELYDLDESGIEHHVTSSIIAINTQVAPTANCFDKWVNAYRQEQGEEAMVHTEQMTEWEQWCAEGKMPGS